MIRLKEIKIRENLSNEEIFEKALAKNKLSKNDVSEWRIYKRSVDARKKDDVHYNYIFDVKLKNSKKEAKFQKVEEYVFPKINIKRKIP